MGHNSVSCSIVGHDMVSLIMLLTILWAQAMRLTIQSSIPKAMWPKALWLTIILCQTINLIITSLVWFWFNIYLWLDRMDGDLCMLRGCGVWKFKQIKSYIECKTALVKRYIAIVLSLQGMNGLSDSCCVYNYKPSFVSLQWSEYIRRRDIVNNVTYTLYMNH